MSVINTCGECDTGNVSKMENANVVNSDLDKVSNSNGQGLKVFIMNRYPPLTSVYRWSLDLSSMLGSTTVQINLIFDNKGWSGPHDGIDFEGRFMKIPSLHHFLRNISYRDAIKYINNERKMGQKVILYYTNQFSGTLKISNVEEIINIQDSPFYLENSSQFGRIYIRCLYETLKHKNHIITNTNALKDELLEFGFDCEITNIYLPYPRTFAKLDLEKKALRKKLGLPADKKLILSVSSNIAQKNLPIIKRVIELLGDDYRLVRVGKPLSNSITYYGIEDSTLNEIYNACDVLLFPSLYEGFGLPIVEAFATGLPFVTSDIPTISEVAGGAAILVNPRDEVLLKDAISEALNEAERLIIKGERRSITFSYANFARSILGLYGRLIRKG